MDTLFPPNIITIVDNLFSYPYLRLVPIDGHLIQSYISELIWGWFLSMDILFSLILKNLLAVLSLDVF